MTSFSVPMEMPNLKAALRDAKSPTTEARWVAALSLAVVNDGVLEKEIVSTLMSLTADKVPEIRAQAIESLAEQARAGVEINPDFVVIALTDSSDAVRCAALSCLEVFCNDGAQHAAKLLADDSPGVRAIAARIIGDTKGLEYVDDVAQLLSDSDAIVQNETALSLLALGDKRGEAIGLKMLLDGGDNAIEAARLLGVNKAVSAKAPLIKIAKSWFSSPALKAGSACALMHLEVSLGKEVLVKMLKSSRSSIRMSALQSLCRLPVAQLLPEVAMLLKNGDPVEVSSAITTMGELGKRNPDLAIELLKAAKPALDNEFCLEIGEIIKEIEKEADVV